MDNLTAIVICFMRTQYTIDCIKSLRETYPDIKIIVGEQVEVSPDKDVVDACEKYHATYVCLPWDCGVGSSRNMLINFAETDYILVGDDDFLYDNNARVVQMLTFIKDTDFDLIGGRIVEKGSIRNYQGHIEIGNDYIKTTPIQNPEIVKGFNHTSGLRYEECDLTFNFFIIKKSTAQECPWDNVIKVAYEHHHFFIGLKKAGKKVAFSPDPIVKHKFQDYLTTQKYKEHRLRRQDKEYYFKSLGINYSIGITGKRDIL